MAVSVTAIAPGHWSLRAGSRAGIKTDTRSVADIVAAAGLPSINEESTTHVVLALVVVTGAALFASDLFPTAADAGQLGRFVMANGGSRRASRIALRCLLVTATTTACLAEPTTTVRETNV